MAFGNKKKQDFKDDLINKTLSTFFLVSGIAISILLLLLYLFHALLPQNTMVQELYAVFGVVYLLPYLLTITACLIAFVFFRLPKNKVTGKYKVIFVISLLNMVLGFLAAYNIPVFQKQMISVRIQAVGSSLFQPSCSLCMVMVIYLASALKKERKGGTSR